MTDRNPRRPVAVLSLLGALMMLGASALALAAPPAGIAGAPSSAEQRWRVAFYQGGDYSEYHDLLVAFFESLGQMGLIDSSSLARDPGQATRPIWQWAAAAERSNSRLTFLADGFYDAGWDEARREDVRASLLHRLRHTDDIDLVLAFGTWAGQDLANTLHDTPVLVISASDAVAAGIVASVEDSGLDHVHAHIDAGRIERQLQLFYHAVGFRSLGVAYEDTAAGRSYAGISQVEALGAKLGFEVVSCHTLSDIADQTRAADTVIDCMTKLADRVDALYVTEQGGVNEQSVPVIAKLAMAKQLASFSQRGSKDVRAGLLLSMDRGAGVRALGQFNARTLLSVMEGARPRDLRQRYEPPSNLAINLDTAHAIGYLPSADILIAADEHYGQLEIGY